MSRILSPRYDFLGKADYWEKVDSHSIKKLLNPTNIKYR